MFLCCALRAARWCSANRISYGQLEEAARIAGSPLSSNLLYLFMNSSKLCLEYNID